MQLRTTITIAVVMFMLIWFVVVTTHMKEKAQGSVHKIPVNVPKDPNHMKSLEILEEMKGSDRGWKSTINKEGCLYASCYCEENIYQLGKQLLTHNEHDIVINQDKLFVLFISNINQQEICFKIWKQRNSPAPDDPVCWDYHVILCCRNNDLSEENNLIFDFDTILPFPVSLSRYIEEAFRPDLQVPVRFKQTLRIVPLQSFLDYFASDRSHMAESKAVAPSWPPIAGEKANSVMNLMKYVNMSSSSSEEDIKLGKVYSFHQFIQWSTSTIDV